MQESQQKETPRSELSIEQQANFEGSWTNLMIERVRNPEIRKQTIDLFYEMEQTEKGSPIGYNDKKKKEYFIQNIDKDTVVRYYIPRTREQIEEDFLEDLDMVENYTPVSFDKNCASKFVDEMVERGTLLPFDKSAPELIHELVAGREVIAVNALDPGTGEKNHGKALNIIESHEKGHLLRTYSHVQSRKKGLIKRDRWEGINARFRKAFDFSKINYHDEYKKIKERIEGESGSMGMTEEDACLCCEFYLRSPHEISERMSQLKNYFGIAGNEKFTKEHLSCAREHYIEDTKYDNNMTQFFQAITPEKEDAFIELINSAGI